MLSIYTDFRLLHVNKIRPYYVKVDRGQEFIGGGSSLSPVGIAEG